MWKNLSVVSIHWQKGEEKIEEDEGDRSLFHEEVGTEEEWAGVFLAVSRLGKQNFPSN